MKFRFLIPAFFFIALSSYAQNELNAYKYIIVPKKFDFQKTENKHQLNSLTKFLFNKEGFTTLFDGDKMSQDLFDNPCLGLKVNAIDGSNMFSTKIILELIDCRTTKVFTSIEGKSKVKEFKRGYQEAIRKAFESVKTLDYKYDDALSTSLKPQITTPIPNSQPKTEALEEVVEEEEVYEIEDVEEVEETMIETSETYNSKIDDRDRDDNGNILGFPTDKKLYAQENRLGYQLVNSKPKIVFNLLKSGTKDVYYLKNRSGNFFKKDGKWYAEYYLGGHLVKQEFEVKW